MSTKVASLYAEIGANTAPFEQGAARVKGQLTALAPGIEGARKGLMSFASENAGLFAILTTSVVATGKALQFSIDQAAEAEVVDAKLAAVLKSTGGAAGMSAGELDKMATSLSRMSTYDDEAIKGSEALLLTFTKVGKEVFPEAQQAILDMSAALGQDLQSSTIQLGKALNDPIAGITALRRVGVSFTEDQKKMIETLVKSGDTLGAQKLILHELSVEFGGQAAAAANTFTGQIAQLQTEVGNLGEAVGNDLLPELKDLIKITKDATIWITDNYQAIRTWAEFTAHMAAPILILKDQVSDVVDKVKMLTGSTKDVTHAEEGHARVINTEVIPSLEDERKIAQAVSDANIGLLGTIEDMQSAKEHFADTESRLQADLIDQQNDYQERLRLNAEEAQKNYAERAQIADDDLDALKRNSEEATKIANERQELEAKNLDAIQKNSEAVKKNQEDYKRANLEIISGLVERKLMQDGVLDDKEFEWLLKKRQEWGLYSADVVAQARAAWQEADKITASVANIPETKDVEIKITTSFNKAADNGHPKADGSSGDNLGASASGSNFWDDPFSYGFGGPSPADGLFSQGFAGLTPDQSAIVHAANTSNTHAIASPTYPSFIPGIDYERMAQSNAIAVRDALQAMGVFSK